MVSVRMSCLGKGRRSRRRKRHALTARVGWEKESQKRAGTSILIRSQTPEALEVSRRERGACGWRDDGSELACGTGGSKATRKQHP